VPALAALLDVVAAQPDPAIQLTSRAALQLRGLPDPVPEDVRRAVAATGLVPSPTHELVRNVVVSPLTGLDARGRCDLRPVVRALDAAVCADPSLAGLPGRFLFVLDDGRGDVVREPFDLGLLALDGGRVAVLVGSPDHGLIVDLDRAAATVAELAREFLTARARSGSSAWHVRELAGRLRTPPLDLTLPPRAPRPVGRVGAHAVVGVPLGLLTRHHVDALSQVVDEVVVTPWRSLVVPDGAGALHLLEDAGLVTTPGSPWVRLHACTGAPGCARTDVDTRGVARSLAASLPAGGMPGGDLPVHVSGCERRCGTPAGPFVDVLAPRTPSDALAALERGHRDHSNRGSETSWT
jgi:precorrin-3B synthase